MGTLVTQLTAGLFAGLACSGRVLHFLHSGFLYTGERIFRQHPVKDFYCRFAHIIYLSFISINNMTFFFVFGRKISKRRTNDHPSERKLTEDCKMASM